MSAAPLPARRAGVVGWPVGHSLSPTLHRAWIAAAGLDADYGAFAVSPEEAARALTSLPESGLVGVNVTVPHKAAALAVAHDATGRAKRIGAANLLTVDAQGRVHADNTDALGFLDGLMRAGADAAGPVVVLGAGGAARAVTAAIADAGCDDVRLVNRTRARADELADLAQGLGMGAAAYDWAGASAALAGARLLVNATSLGMAGAPPLPSLELSRLAEDAAVYDLVYVPRETALLTAARLQGLTAIEGLDMLIGQARPSFEAFFNSAPPESVDARALLTGAAPSHASVALAGEPRMMTVGLTGSIGMGKSTAARMFADAGVPVFDADAVVHELYAPGGAGAAAIAEAFPAARAADGGVDRAALRTIVQADPQAFRRLEAVVHPLVARERREFLARARRRGVDLVVLDIPLLFETGGEEGMDAVVVVSASPEVQRRRVLGRPGMTPDALDAILARQVPDAVKRASADYVIDTSGSLLGTRLQIARILRSLRRRAQWRRAGPRPERGAA